MSIEAALFAFLRERSAQVGERFDMEMFQQLKADYPEQFDDEMVQMRCAIKNYEAGRKASEQPVSVEPTTMPPPGMRFMTSSTAHPEPIADQPVDHTDGCAIRQGQGCTCVFLKRESVESLLADALKHIHDYAKGKDLDDGYFIERCAYTALSRIEGDKPCDS